MPPEPPLRPHDYAPTCKNPPALVSLLQLTPHIGSYTGLHADGVSIAITFFNINLDDTRYNAKLERVCNSARRWCVHWVCIIISSLYDHQSLTNLQYSCLHQHSAWKHPVTMPARPPPADDEWDWSMVHPSEASADLQRQYQSIWDLTVPIKERFRLNFGGGITPPPLGDEDNARFLQSIRQ